ncbi:DUF4249 domain-containing protein [Spirosoma sp. KCTC 42546]|uniref:DUF4249 domain-containing protein n=1 Tax=Spirosoma sp. KCTC 42546 TaxID=2520506 RepID=UPI0011582A47|nr:DUF4249 domain-containing protein [Spirosoma sp. KCTC 42546]QDK77350.1 DUF4249 domain-containing protein [Spirosoma sp. KCTC 42546]
MHLTRHIHRAFFALSALPVLLGCTSLRNEVDPSQLGLAAPKLVVSGFFCPQDTVLTVKVTRSNTVVGDSISLLQTGNNITDAMVTLSEGDRSVVLPYTNINPGSDSSQSFYGISARRLPIIAGRTYKLTVVTATGQRATSTCTIPQAVDPTSIKFDSLTETQNRRQTERYFVTVRWKDPAGQTNSYQVAGIFRYTTAANVREERYNSLSFDDENRGLFPDAGVDGTQMESGRAFLTANSSTGNLQTSFYSQYNTATVTVNLLSVDQSYYRYQEAIIRQRRSRNNPFAEPVLIPSNIEGGLGCFAGYNNATLTMKLK